MNDLSQKQKRILLSALAVIFFTALGYSFAFAIPPLVDARAYDTIAWHLAQGLGYRESLDVPLNEDNAIIRVGPGYEFFLAGIYYLFGHHIQIIWILHALLLALSSFLVFLLSRLAFRDHWNFKLGLAATLFVGLSPDLITIQGMLMTETLGIFLIVLTVYLFFRLLEKETPSPGALFVFGLFFGAAVLVRTPALFLAIPFLYFFASRKLFRSGGIFLAAAGLIFIPWTVRNWQVYHRFLPTNAASGFNLLAGNHPGANGEQEPYPPLDRYVQELGHLKANEKATREALSFVVGHPLEFLKLTVLRTSIYFSFARPTGFWFHLQGPSRAVTIALSSLYALLLFTLGFWGVARIRGLTGEARKRGFYLLALGAMMPLALISVIVETRYRFLVYPFLAIFAGLAIKDLFSGKMALKPALYLVSLLFLNTGFDIFRNVDRILERIKEL